jgi:hypothetical protein
VYRLCPLLPALYYITTRMYSLLCTYKYVASYTPVELSLSQLVLGLSSARLFSLLLGTAALCILRGTLKDLSFSSFQYLSHSLRELGSQETDRRHAGRAIVPCGEATEESHMWCQLLNRTVRLVLLRSNPATILLIF